MENIQSQVIDTFEKEDFFGESYECLMQDGQIYSVDEPTFYKWLSQSEYCEPLEQPDYDAGRPAYISSKTSAEEIIDNHPDILEEALNSFIQEGGESWN